MPRHKEFDRDDVLAKAMQTFWSQGYAATSVQDLVESMGINRGSLYDTFGDKHSLFLAAIAHYEAAAIQPAIARLEAPGAGKQAIAEHFYSLVERASSDPEQRGCFATNAAVELCARDRDVADRVAASLQHLERALKRALQTAQAQGELTGDRNLDELASFLLCTLQGLRVVSKLNPDRERLRGIVRAALTVLD